MSMQAQCAPDDAGIPASPDEHSAVLAFIALAWSASTLGADPPAPWLLKGFADIELERSRRRSAAPWGCA